MAVRAEHLHVGAGVADFRVDPVAVARSPVPTAFLTLEVRKFLAVAAPNRQPVRCLVVDLTMLPPFLDSVLITALASAHPLATVYCAVRSGFHRERGNEKKLFPVDCIKESWARAGP
jgi:hypothetical protein